MWIIDGVVAGLIAGIIMVIISQLGYWIGIIRSHLIVIDGNFVLRKIRLNSTTLNVYVIGILIHLITSVVFGFVYVLISKLFSFDLRTVGAITLYVLILWLSMLFIALPIAGQRFWGNGIRYSILLEQFVLHGVFGVSFWWALGIV